MDLANGARPLDHGKASTIVHSVSHEAVAVLYGTDVRLELDGTLPIVVNCQLS